MKILYLVTSADLGGAQQYVLDLASYFHGVIAAGGEQNHLFDGAQKLGIPYFKLRHMRRRINPRRDFLSLLEITTVIRKIKPQIAHVNSSKMGFLGSIAGKLNGCKVVYTIHGAVLLEDKNYLWKLFVTLLERFAGHFRDLNIAVSKNDEVATKNYGIDPNKIQTIHNGMRQINFLDKYEARLELGLPQDKIVIGTISNLYRNKGVDILIKAAKQILDPQIIFAIIGDGPEKSELLKEIDREHLSNRFILLGEKTNAASYLKAFDIFVLASRKEGFPYVLLEAMSASLAIISTDVGGNKEALGNAAILIPSNDADQLAWAITKLVTNEKRRRELAAKATLQAMEFTLEKMLNQTKTIYENLK